MHETLYHLHQPETEAEANSWLMRFLLHYNSQSHRHSNLSRMEDWVKNLPSEGIRQMCSWERFCTFAREPERRKVSIDARVSVDGVSYEVDPDLAGEKVILWWGLFDHELYVEHEEQKYGPYSPIGAPIPLHRYRRFKKTRIQLFEELNHVVRQGRFIALSGMVGSGKTTTIQSLIQNLRKGKEVVVSSSLAVDKERVNLGTLITALFYDLSTEKDLTIPTQPEKRERKLLALIQKCRQPIVLLVDDAHSLHHSTKRGIEKID